MSKITDTLKLIFNDKLLNMLIEPILCGILFIVLGIAYSLPWMLYAGAVLTFTMFDILGFKLLLTKVVLTEYKTSNVAYRIIQTMFQILLGAYIYTFFPIVALCYLLTWWFGTCDHFFYVFSEEDFTGYRLTWLWWTFPGILFSIFDKVVTPRWFTIFSYSGMIISLLLIYLWK